MDTHTGASHKKNSLKGVSVCFFGDYDEEHNRTKMLIRGLALEGVEVRECHVGHEEKKRYWKLFVQYQSLKNTCDVVFLGHSSDRWLPLVARVITLGKILFWDVQFSFYDNWVFDRKLAKPKSIKALYYWCADYFNCRIVDRIILDTYEHFEYFKKTFGVPPLKLVRVASSADTRIFFPRPKSKSDGVFRVEYHGKYIPVQGVDVVVRAAKILEHEPDIQFTLIGDGQEKRKTIAMAEKLGLTNITFLPFLPLDQIPNYIAEADLCVGLVGDIPRVRRTVANKVYEAAAMERVSVNADVPAVRELFTGGVDIMLVKQGDEEDLARKILFLRDNPAILKAMSKATYETFIEKCSPESVGRQLGEGIRRSLGL